MCVSSGQHLGDKVTGYRSEYDMKSFENGRTVSSRLVLVKADTRATADKRTRNRLKQLNTLFETLSTHRSGVISRSGGVVVKYYYCSRAMCSPERILSAWWRSTVHSNEYRAMIFTVQLPFDCDAQDTAHSLPSFFLFFLLFLFFFFFLYRYQTPIDLSSTRALHAIYIPSRIIIVNF